MQEELLMYRNRLINLSTKNRTILLRKLYKKIAFDLELLEGKNGGEFCERLLKLLADRFDGKIKILTPPYDECTIKYLDNFKKIQKETSYIQREQGSYNLYIGYPFIEGKFKDGTFIKSPLLLFPIELSIENDEVFLSNIEDTYITINRAFIMAFKKYNETKLNDFNLKFENINNAMLPWISNYLAENGIYIETDYSEKTVEKFREVTNKTIANYKIGELVFRNNMILGQFPNSMSPIYEDYNKILNKNIESESLYNLIKNNSTNYKGIDTIKLAEDENYFVTELDYSQEKAIVASEKSKELVIYGPPGTGKSQVIVNLIVNNLAKGKKVLMISQKKAAIDVVYNRLKKIGLENNIADIESANADRDNIFNKIKNTLENQNSCLKKEYDLQFKNISKIIKSKMEELEKLAHLLNKETKFGLTLNQLYSKSINKYEYYIDELGEDFENFKDINHIELEGMINSIEKISKYLKYESDDFILKNRNSFEDIQEIEKGRILNLLKRIEKVADHYNANKDNDSDITYIEDLILKRNINTGQFLKALVKVLNAIKNSKGKFNGIGAKSINKLFSLNEEIKHKRIWTLSYWKSRKELKDRLKLYNKNYKLKDIIKIIDEESEIYYLITNLNKNFGIFDINYNNDLSENINRLERYIKGVKIIDEVTSQINLLAIYFNEKFLKYLTSSVLENKQWRYLIEDIHSTVELEFENIKTLDYLKSKLSDKEKLLINYCFKPNSYKFIRNTIYLKHIQEIEKENKQIISCVDSAENIRLDIEELLEEKRQLAPNVVKNKINKDLKNNINYNNIKYEVDKKRNKMSLRRFTHLFYNQGLLEVLPCWLCTPEAVSTIFPLEEGIFDLVIFDEASQMFIEDSIPSIYRSKKVVIVGDDKQLQPNSLYQVKLDEDLDELSPMNTEAKSLLELAKYKYPGISLNYHYRSVHEELINFSNYAFYNGKIEIVPNKNKGTSQAIKRIKVDGRWIDRRNIKEAEEVVSIVKRVFLNRQENETIGIITFNSNQRDYVEELLERESNKDIEFGVLYRKELERREGNEYKGIFVKNIENVQGDERDIIIFSIGYAPNEEGRVVRQFGTLTTKAGENRLNVAISRARKKIYIVTSVEPEELGYVDNLSKGAILLKKYLQYARAVSNGNDKEAKEILYSLDTIEKTERDIIHFDSPFEEEVYEELVRVGFDVYTQVGTSGYRIDMAIYDEEKSEYILGIECDGATYHSSKSARERDMYRQRFLESRGWIIHRIWSRDWWKNKQREVEKIKMRVKELEK